MRFPAFLRSLARAGGALVAAGALRAGTIAGTVRAVAPTPPGGEAADSAYSSRRYKFVEKIDYERLQDFVVYIDELVVAPAGPPAARIVQRDATFEPHVLPIVVGTTVRWPNEDDIFHNVFSMTETQDFNLGFYKRDKVPEVQFDRLGRVDVFCAIHTNMHCIILVLPNRYFAVADAHRHFTIANVPAGTYRLKAWHERLPSQVRPVVVPAAGEVKVDFTLGVAELPKP
jgi:polysaccharide lyase family 4-like protein